MASQTKFNFEQSGSLFAVRFSLFAFRFSYFTLLISYLGFGNSIFAQVTLQGSIFEKNSGQPLTGANIIVENTFLSTVSDESGNYVIHGLKPAACSLKISFMGYKTILQSYKILRDTILNFAMETSAILGEEVNIISTRAQTNTPTTFSTLTNKEINAVNVGQDMPYILQSTPSVVVTSDAGNGIGYTGIYIRGTDLTRINVTMNGVPLNDAESQGVWFVDLPDLASSTQNIQVQRGVGTSSNGPGAFGATINIQTLNMDPDPYAELNASAGSFGTTKTTFRFGSGMLKEKFAFDGRASLITSNGYIDRATANLKSFSLSGGYFGKKTTLKFVIMSGWEKTYQAWEGVPKDSLATNRTYNPSGEYRDPSGNIAYYKNQTDNYNQSHFQLIFSQESDRDFNLNAALFYTKGTGYYENYEQDQDLSSYGLNNVILGGDTVTTTDMITQKWLDNDFYGITFSCNYQGIKKLKLTGGGALSYYSGKHFGKIPWAQFASNGDNEREWYYNTGKKSDFNLYLKAYYQVLEKLNLFGDLQYRNVQYKISGDLESLSLIDQAHSFNFFNPKAGISYDLNNHHHLYFSFATGNREPSRNNYEVADSAYMPQPEKLFDYELGYNLRFSNFTASACIYYMRYHDQLVLTGQINTVGEPIMTNVPKSYRTGIEVSMGAQLLKWLKWDLNSTFSLNKILDYTEYVDTYDSSWNFSGQTPVSLGTTDISFSPGIIASNIFTFIPLKNLSLSLTSRYIGRQYIDNTSDRSRSLDPCFVNGLLIGYDLHTKVFKNIGFTLAVNNLFSQKYETSAWVYRYYQNDQAYESNGYFPQAMINFLAGITIKI